MPLLSPMPQREPDPEQNPDRGHSSSLIPSASQTYGIVEFRRKMDRACGRPLLLTLLVHKWVSGSLKKIYGAFDTMTFELQEPLGPALYLHPSLSEFVGVFPLGSLSSQLLPLHAGLHPVENSADCMSSSTYRAAVPSSSRGRSLRLRLLWRSLVAAACVTHSVLPSWVCFSLVSYDIYESVSGV